MRDEIMNAVVCFLGGFALLPFLWLINSVWFFRDAFLAEAFDEQKRIRSCEFIQCCRFIIRFIIL